MDHDTLAALDPATRCYALVGFFLQAWSLMEARLNSTIAKAFGLDDFQQHIVCSNMGLRGKLHTLRTAIWISAIPEKTKTVWDKKLVDLDKYAWVRNMLAHDLFGPCPEGTGVEFLPVRAKGRINFPKEIWDIDRFFTEVRTVNDYSDLLREMERQIGYLNIAKLLLKSDTIAPIPEPAGQGLLSLLAHPSPESHKSAKSRATPAKAARTRRTPPRSKPKAES